jgi:hypothetical protein
LRSLKLTFTEWSMSAGIILHGILLLLTRPRMYLRLKVQFPDPGIRSCAVCDRPIHAGLTPVVFMSILSFERTESRAPELIVQASKLTEAMHTRRHLLSSGAGAASVTLRNCGWSGGRSESVEILYHFDRRFSPSDMWPLRSNFRRFTLPFLGLMRRRRRAKIGY